MNDNEREPEELAEETEGEDECAPEPEAKIKGKGKGGPKPQSNALVPSATSTGQTAVRKKHVYPFNVRYASVILDLAGFVDGQAYTDDQIKELLIQNGLTEFRDVQPSFHMNDETRTLVITIQGSKKGALIDLSNLVKAAANLVFKQSPPKVLATRLPEHLLRMIETRFRETYAQFGTEDRILVYADEHGNLGAVTPQWTRNRAFVAGDLPLSMELDGRFWDLAFDLHSHHTMGVFWSGTDDANERLRGPVYGVFSWRGNRPAWLFRRWVNPQTEFEALRYSDVVTSCQAPVQLLQVPPHA